MADDHLPDDVFQTLAGFRLELRRFLHFSECAARRAGLTSQQHQALLAIRAAPDAELVIGALAEQLMLRPHSATELIDRLARLELVERVQGRDDKRKVRVRMTPHGRAVLASLAAAHRAELHRIRPLFEQLIGRL